MGLVTHDGATVYEVLTAECARTNATVEAEHRQARWVKPPARPPLSLTPPRLSPVIDGSLAEWPPTASVTPWTSESLGEGDSCPDRFQVATDRAYLYLGASIRDAHLDDPGADWEWEGDYLAIYAHPGATESGDSTALYLYPVGGGPDRSRPVASFWGGKSPGPGTRISRKNSPGGYTLEARIPLKGLAGYRPGRHQPWTLMLNGRDVSGIRESWWEGIVTLP